jgi:serine protease Do
MARTPRALQVSQYNPNLPQRFLRLSRTAVTAAMALSMSPLALVPVRAQSSTGEAPNAPATTAAPAPQIQVDNTPLTRTAGVNSFSPIVEKVTPAIVTVYTSRKVTDNGNGNQPGGNPMLRRFFGMPDSPDGGSGDGSGKIEGLGSGVIVSSDGLILTNNHVAEAGDQILVRIGDHGREYKAKVVGNDPTSDLALLRIDAKNLPTLTFADSEKVKVGDIVLAVGNPFTLTDTVTMGIVSALGRTAALEDDGSGAADYQDFIQTDAAINPGNSGGALVDTEGRLIGINTAIYSRTGGNQGIGFAVPSDLARDVIDSLLKNGKVTRGYLGTVVQELNPDLAEQFKVPDDQQGALIAEVAPGSAAEKAGLKNGDIITSVNGKPIDDPHGLRLVVGGMAPGAKVSVAYLRDGQSQTSEVALGEQGKPGELADNSSQTNERPNVLDGITVGDLDDSSRNQLKVPGDVKGVLVTDVSSDSVGYDAGLRKGDVILEINRKPLATADDAVNEGNSIAKSEKVLLHIWSDSRTEFLVLKPRE